jgi:hypothetical protein
MTQNEADRKEDREQPDGPTQHGLIIGATSAPGQDNDQPAGALLVFRPIRAY